VLLRKAVTSEVNVWSGDYRMLLEVVYSTSGLGVMRDFLNLSHRHFYSSADFLVVGL
jgi:hypothetical protein